MKILILVFLSLSTAASAQTLDLVDLPAEEEARILYGAQIPLHDKYQPPGGLSIRRSASMRKDMTPVKNQGGRGTCSAFAAIALIDSVFPPNYLDTDITYSEQCLVAHMGSGDSGHVLERLEWARDHDIFYEQNCPYNPFSHDAPSPGSFNNSQSTRPRIHLETETFGWLSNDDPIAFIRRAISQNRLVAASIIVAGFWWDDSATTPRYVYTGSLLGQTALIDMMQALRDPDHRELLRLHWYKSDGEGTGIFWDPITKTRKSRTFDEFFASASRLEVPDNQEIMKSCQHSADMASSGKKQCSSHAIAITGFDDETETLEFKNSWGPEFKNEGYGYMSYAYYRRLHASFSSENPLISINSFYSNYP